MPPKKAAPLPKPNEKKKRVTKSSKAGLLMPVTRIRNKMKEGRYAKIIGTGGAVFMAGVLEYVAAEILECAGTVARDNQKQRINPRHINVAVRSDSELDKLFKDITIPGGGVLPFIHEVLLPKAKTANTEMEAETDDGD
ncbi:histone H2A-beta, sperm-like [Bradysia coprophila]|uniref:histone H2A-beta, sperm-like n=1 Tax=Bradysia coprophila TaxID=38358 RepID=UPI00187DAC01|nr:histone H2A-beta, sperm-like [Bradysia coprophila]